MPSTPNHATDHRRVSRPAFYIPQLDCLRFVAFFLVFLHHNIPTSEKVTRVIGENSQQALLIFRDTAGMGLCLFFFLSSFLITSLLSIEKNASGTINLRSFYVRRVLRIWPLYFVFLIAVAVVGLWLPAEHIEPARFAAMSLLAGNWYAIAFGLGPFVIGPLWSISVEEQFYAIWPSLFRNTSRSVFLGFSLLIAASSLLATAIFASHGASSLDLWMNSLCEALFFAAGGVMALLINVQRKQNAALATLLIALGCAAWIAVEVFCKINDRHSQPVPLLSSIGYLGTAIGCALMVIGSLHFPAEYVPGWLVYSGKISYGLYVFHELAVHLLRSTPEAWHLRLPGVEFTVALVLTFIFASISYKYLEKPFLKFKHRFELVKTRSE